MRRVAAAAGGGVGVMGFSILSSTDIAPRVSQQHMSLGAEEVTSNNEREVRLNPDSLCTSASGHKTVLRSSNKIDQANSVSDEETVHNDGEMSLGSAMVSASLTPSARRHLHENPVSSRELDAVFDEFERSPEMIEDICVGADIPVGGLRSLRDNVRRLLSHENVFERACQRVSNLNPSQSSTIETFDDALYESSSVRSEDGYVDVYSSSTTNDNSNFIRTNDHLNVKVNCFSQLNHSQRDMSSSAELWSQLRTNHRVCQICQDILAKPVTTNCSHSFCGVCLENFMQSAVSESENVEVIHKCPACREDIEHTTMCIALHEEMRELVKFVPDCQEKTEWNMRCDEYTRIEKRKERLKRKEGNSVASEEEDKGWMGWLGGGVLATLALIVMVVVLRGRRF